MFKAKGWGLWSNFTAPKMKTTLFEENKQYWKFQKVYKISNDTIEMNSIKIEKTYDGILLALV